MSRVSALMERFSFLKMTQTMQDFINNYCTCEIDAIENKPKHVIEKHVKDILINTLQPVFKRQVQIHPTLSNRPEPKYRAAHESELHENQLWKNEEYVEILAWIIQEISVSFASDLKLYQLDGFSHPVWSYYRQRISKRIFI
jgi:hypothetical protein